MKTLKLFVIAFAAISINAYAQKSNVPENVNKAFTQKFPEAKSVKWDKENETEWEAEFKLKGEEYSANFSTDGSWKETEHEIETSAIPVNVKQTLDSEFVGYKIEEAEISETAEGSVYEFKLEKDKVKMEVTVSPDGRVVKKEVITEKKEEKETIFKKNEPVKVVKTNVVFENLDQTLSPFEDLIEFALAKNDKGIQNSLSKIDSAAKNNVFANNLKPESINVLNEEIVALNNYFEKRDYTKTALTSAEIFDYNVSNFKDASKIENQIKIEHLDYLGFKLLALLDQKQIEWEMIEQTTQSVEQVWKSLSPEVKDSNLKASFDLLFDGIHLSAKEKNKKMVAIFANMDLDLVDVLEKTFL